jgi:hypothetical protein
VIVLLGSRRSAISISRHYPIRSAGEVADASVE